MRPAPCDDGGHRPVEAFAVVRRKRREETFKLRGYLAGRFIADPSRQREVFGQVPTAEEAIARFVRSLGPARDAA